LQAFTEEASKNEAPAEVAKACPSKVDTCWVMLYFKKVVIPWKILAQYPTKTSSTYHISFNAFTAFTRTP
jgi:hypothetical protein